MSNKRCLTVSVPEAGEVCFDLSHNGSYAAADRGDIPTIRVGRLRRVSVDWIRRTLGSATPSDDEIRPRRAADGGTAMTLHQERNYQIVQAVKAGSTMAAVAREVGLSSMRVSQICRRAEWHEQRAGPSAAARWCPSRHIRCAEQSCRYWSNNGHRGTGAERIGRE